MSWSIEERIGECRPFPAQVVVYRGETDECLAYVSGEVADRLKAENASLRERITTQKQTIQAYRDESREWREVAEHAQAENDKLREQIERLQPTDCEGNVLDIADTVNMLRSEYDGDHEWEDVVTELVLTKWGGDRWIVRGSKGEAWACDCTKTGYDEDAYESSDDVEPFGEPTLLEVENAKLRELVEDMFSAMRRMEGSAGMDALVGHSAWFAPKLHELGIEVDE